MSGRLAGVLVLAICAGLVTTAFVIRSQATSRVRYFWTPQGAAHIQSCKHVTALRIANKDADTVRSDAAQTGTDLTGVPGLIHVRATLVEDRYYEWATLETAVERSGTAHADAAEEMELKFIDEQGHSVVHARIDLEHGWVTNVLLKRRVQLIASSRQAIVAYFRQVVP